MAKLNEKTLQGMARDITTRQLAKHPFGIKVERLPMGYYVSTMRRKGGAVTCINKTGALTAGEAEAALMAVAHILEELEK
jgi:hypothetical protein